MSTYVVVKWLREGAQKQMVTRIPKVTDIEVAKQRILTQFPGAQIVDAVVKGAVDATPAKDVVAEKASATKFTSGDQPKPHVTKPTPEDTEKLEPSTADLGQTPVAPHLQHLSAAHGHAPTPTLPFAVPAPHPPPVRGTAQSDGIAQQMYPRLGDSVMVDVDKIPVMERREHHHFLRAHGMHGAYGQVRGSKVEGGLYLLLVETGSNSVWTDARCVVTAEPVPQPRMMQDDSRKSPELMRKHSNGSYNMT